MKIFYYMKISYYPVSFHTRQPFYTSKGVRSVFPHILLKCCYDEFIGYGSMVLLPTFFEQPQKIVSIIHAFDAYKKHFEEVKIDENNIMFTLETIMKLYPEGAFALEMAVLDVLSKRSAKPLYEYLGLQSKELKTSITIGFKSMQNLEEDLALYKNWVALKVKLGANLEENLQKIDFIFKNYNGSVRLDVNGALGFNDACKFFEKLDKYPESFVEYVEQPIAIKQYENLKFLKNNFKTDIFADEDVTSIEDIDIICECVDGVNVKSYLGDGLRTLLYNNYKAKTLGLKTMLGCQVESVLGITALSHIAYAFDTCDLDGHLFFKEDYFVGLEINNGNCLPVKKNGIGAELIKYL